MGFWGVVKNVVKNSDIVLLVCDARMPELSKNSGLEEMALRYRKRIVFVFTKIDLVSEKYLENVKRKYSEGFFVSGVKNIGVGRLKRNLFIIAKRIGVKRARIGVVGYPNVGKSALINALAKRALTRVARYAGTTRGIQWIKAGGLFILDSPGVIPYKDSEIALGILGSKDSEKLQNIERVAFEVVKIFVNYDRKILEDLYGIRILDDYSNILEEIGRKKGFLLKGGVIDEKRAALLILRDWQRGKLRL